MKVEKRYRVKQKLQEIVDVIDNNIYFYISDSNTSYIEVAVYSYNKQYELNDWCVKAKVICSNGEQVKVEAKIINNIIEVNLDPVNIVGKHRLALALTQGEKVMGLNSIAFEIKEDNINMEQINEYLKGNM